MKTIIGKFLGINTPLGYDFRRVTITKNKRTGRLHFSHVWLPHKEWEHLDLPKFMTYSHFKKRNGYANQFKNLKKHSHRVPKKSPKRGITTLPLRRSRGAATSPENFNHL